MVFYVADWHPFCAAQVARYRDLDPELTRLGADILAISSDTVWSHAAFAHAQQLSFPLLATIGPEARSPARTACSTPVARLPSARCS